VADGSWLGGATRRRIANLAVVAWLAVQLAVPALYYLRGGGPDERFAWRMYSTHRLTRCGVALNDYPEGGGKSRSVELNRAYHRAWISLLSRGQPRVADAVMEDQCRRGDVARVRVRWRCVTPDGEAQAAVYASKVCG